MQQIKLIRAINETSEKYYGGALKDINDHQKYLEECNKYLFEYLNDTLKDCFIFSALSYINLSTQKTYIAKGTDDSTGYNLNIANDEFHEELKKSVDDVLSGKMISMTYVLLSKNNRLVVM